MILIRLFIVSILFFSTLNNNPKDNTTFISPVKIPLLLSANFGELRIDHFHSGLDIKTQGETGKEVVSAADGYIFRIGVSPGGFGKAIYIRHASGFSTVYGHLDRFTPEIEKFVKAQQYEKKSYQVTLFPERDKFPVLQGDLIGYSGNSGASGGPHLHFEIRKSESEIPVNPLLFDLGTKDNIKPVIEKLAIYPINKNSLINSHHRINRINVEGSDGKYIISNDNEITISGVAGFGIKSYDLLNDSYNKCAVYSIELKIDSNIVFKYAMDGFSFDESRYVNSHIDYETFMKDNIYIERAYVLPNDKLRDYKDVVNRGVFNFSDNRVHHIRITVSDVNDNKSTLSFNVRSVPGNYSGNDETADKDLKIMPYNKSNKFVSEDISVYIPSGALYDTLYFSYNKTPGKPDMLSDIFSVSNKFTPVNKAFTLSIKPAIIPAGKESKMLVAQIADDDSRKTYKSSLNDGYLTADVLSFGNFYAGIDTIAPDISPVGQISGANLSGKKEMRIKITDDFSGIKSYEPVIDGKWALFEYDQKNNVLIYRFDDQRIKRASQHSLSLKVTDNTDNVSSYNCDFTW
jgi:hypothetical protein